MSVFARLAALITAATVVLAESSDILAAPYAGTKVLRIPTGNESSLFQYDELINRLQLPTWTEEAKIDSAIDVEVASQYVDEFTKTVEGIIASHNIEAPIVTMHEDLGASIAAESAGVFESAFTNEGFRTAEGEVSAMVDVTWFNAYHSYADHVTYINQLAAQFPNNARVVSAGKSGQGRDLIGLQIYGSSGPNVKPAIVYHSTVHAREWITTMVNEFTAWKLLSEYTGASKVYVDKFDFFIFPFSNPDGFVFTQTTTRLWRKNRRAAPSGSTCLGVDINRNWPHSSWGQSGGASTSPCAEDYKGPSSGSEPETTALSAWLRNRQSVGAGVISYLDWHSYSQLVMSPYGYTCSKQAADATELNTLTAGFATALRAVNGVRFTSGPICQTIYQASGGSVDWAYDNGGVKYSFTVELRDTGANGFVLPPAQILPSGLEAYAGLKYFWDNIRV